MAHRFQAPKHTTEVFTSTGPKRADKHGIIELAADAPRSDHDQLRQAGCKLVAEEAAAEAAPKSAPAKKA